LDHAQRPSILDSRGLRHWLPPAAEFPALCAPRGTKLRAAARSLRARDAPGSAGQKRPGLQPRQRTGRQGRHGSRHGRVARRPRRTAGLAALAAAGIAPFERREDARAALWAELDRTPGWLLVYDNADEPAQLEPFLPAARHGDVILTSRNPAWRRIAHPVAIGPLARGESLAYVATRTGDRPVEADTLAELLGDLPLALEQACAYIEQTRMSLPDYVSLFRRHRNGLLLREVEGSGRTVATTWGLAFDRLAVRAAGGRTAGDDRLPGPGRDLGRHAGPVRAGSWSCRTRCASCCACRWSTARPTRCGCTGWCRTWCVPG
jgi:hypothetical protein